MNWLRRLRTRIRALIQRREVDGQLDDELRFHVEMQARENIDSGMSPEAARRAALHQLGFVESIKEECRDHRRLVWLERLIQDISYGSRLFRKNPVFTAAAVLILSVGIGLNTAVVTMIDSLLFKPIQAHRPEQLAGLFQRERENPENYHFFSFADFSELRADKSVFSDLAAFPVRRERD